MMTTKKKVPFVLFLFLVGASCFSVEEEALVGLLMGCPCPDEVACIRFNGTTVDCVNIGDVDSCQNIPFGITECGPCVTEGLEWCRITFGNTNSAACTKDCDFLATLLPNLFNQTSPVNRTDDCPTELLCPDCDGDDDAEVKIKICHKPGTPAEKTLKVPPRAVPGHLGHGDTIGSCGNHGRGRQSVNTLPKHHNPHTFVKNSGNTSRRNSLLGLAVTSCLVSMLMAPFSM